MYICKSIVSPKITSTRIVKFKRVSNIKVALVGVGIIFIYMTVLSPIVTYGRNNIAVGGVNTLAGVEQIVSASVTSEASDFVHDISPGVQRGWARLNYANAQAFAVERYNLGYPGDTFSDVLWVLLPRSLFPDKPNFSHGSKFNQMVDGNPYSSSGPGIIVEGYWNGGWTGVVFVCFFMAMIYAGWEKYIYIQISRERFDSAT